MFVKKWIGKILPLPEPSNFGYLRKQCLTVRDFECLKQAMGWEHYPIISEEECKKFLYMEDLNFRRLRDAEVILGACRNEKPETILEIGTSYGFTTLYMSRNAPDAQVYTVNLPPEGAANAGKNITHVLEKNEIGKYYRENGRDNVHQILANTADWTPDCGPVDIAFIDGCHDADFVYNDTLKILPLCGPGSIIIWHDFNLELMSKYHWINDVVKGVERLYAERHITGPILHLQDSWCGLYKVQ